MRAVALSSLLLLGVTMVGASQRVPVRYETLKASKAGYYKAQATIPVFASNHAVSKVASRAVAGVIRKSFNEFVTETREMINDPDMKEFWKSNQGRPTAPFFHSSEPKISVSVPSLISLLIENYDYSGGAHPNTILDPHNFGIVNGKAQRLTLDNLVIAGRKPQLIKSIILPRLMELKKARFGSEDIGPEPTIDNRLADRFLITPAGISWVFEPYAVGAYAEGVYIVKVPWSDLLPHMTGSGKEIISGANAAAGLSIDSNVVGTWFLQAFEYSDDTTIKIGEPNMYMLRINADGSSNLRVDINRGTGSVYANDSTFKFTGGALTKAMPSPNSHHDRFLRDLSNVATYVVKGNMLYLNLKMDGGNLVFKKA